MKRESLAGALVAAVVIAMAGSAHAAAARPGPDSAGNVTSGKWDLSIGSAS